MEYEFEILQDGMVVASGSCANRDRAIAEAHHYAMMYGQDGPVEVIFKTLNHPLPQSEPTAAA